jgi:hypothetical protein
MNHKALSSEREEWRSAMVEDDDARETFTTEAQRRTERAEEIKRF